MSSCCLWLRYLLIPEPQQPSIPSLLKGKLVLLLQRARHSFLFGEDGEFFLQGIEDLHGMIVTLLWSGNEWLSIKIFRNKLKHFDDNYEYI